MSSNWVILGQTVFEIYNGRSGRVENLAYHHTSTTHLQSSPTTRPDLCISTVPIEILYTVLYNRLVDRNLMSTKTGAVRNQPQMTQMQSVFRGFQDEQRTSQRVAFLHQSVAFLFHFFGCQRNFLVTKIANSA